MGQYINEVNGKPLPDKGKADFLIQHAHAKKVDGKTFIPDLVCVVENRFFDGAGYCFDEREYEAFAYPDNRPRTWLYVPGASNLAK